MSEQSGRVLRAGALVVVALIQLTAIGDRRSAAAASEAGPPMPSSIASPAGEGSREPNLVAMPDGRVLMSWLEPEGSAGMALRCSTFDGTGWSTPSTIAAGDSFFVNGADFPSVRPLGGNRLVAHWLWQSAAAADGHDIRISQSEDAGRTWGAPVTPHRDGTATEHGFVALASNSGSAFAVWLDGRKMAGHPEDSPGPMPDMTLRTASVTREGALRDELELDGRTCDCCQTAAVMTDHGILVAYRDRSPDDVRDIVVMRRSGGRWSAPRPVHADHWHLTGCPVNGPALDAQRSHVAIGWYTAAADSPRVYVAFSEDAGAHFGQPIRIDAGNPIGRVHLTLLADGSALATWLEGSGRDGVVRARRIPTHGAPGAAIDVAGTSAARARGCPRVASFGKSVMFAWTETGTTPRVRVATMSSR